MKTKKPTDMIGRESVRCWDRVNKVMAVLTENGDVILEEVETNKVIAHIPARYVKDALEVLQSVATDESK